MISPAENLFSSMYYAKFYKKSSLKLLYKHGIFYRILEFASKSSFVFKKLDKVLITFNSFCYDC